MNGAESTMIVHRKSWLLCCLTERDAGADLVARYSCFSTGLSGRSQVAASARSRPVC